MYSVRKSFFQDSSHTIDREKSFHGATEVVCMYQVVVADDEATVLDGLVAVLRTDPDIEVVGHTTSGGDALSLAVVLSPDVLILDLRMPDMGGLAISRRLLDAGRTRPGVLALTSHADQSLLMEAWAAGVRGLLLKTSAPSDLLHAVHKVARGGVVVDSLLTQEVLDRLARSRHPAADDFERRWVRLTPQEKRAVMGASQGFTNQVIADDLGVAEGTVKSHISRAMGKLNMRNRTHIAAVFSRMRENHQLRVGDDFV